jgi:hypothetical protein
LALQSCADSRTPDNCEKGSCFTPIVAKFCHSLAPLVGEIIGFLSPVRELIRTRQNGARDRSLAPSGMILRLTN